MGSTVKILICLFNALSFILMITLETQANVPPPPANQIIGINDGVFNNLTESDCRLCHENPDQFPVKERIHELFT